MITTTKASFSRPSGETGYGSGYLIGNSANAAEVEPMVFSLNKVGGACRVTRATLYKSSNGIWGAWFRVHLFSRPPKSAVGDNGGKFKVETVENYLGGVSINMQNVCLASDTDIIAWGKVDPPICFDSAHLGPNNEAIYGLLEADGMYEAASGERFVVTLDIESE